MTSFSKEYGKLTSDQLHGFVGMLPDLFATLREMDSHIAAVPADRFDEVMTGDYGQYCLAYEAPFETHLSLVVFALDRVDEVRQFAGSPDPQQAVLDALRQHDVDNKPHNEQFDVANVLGLCYSLARTIQSMARYGRSISGLLEDVREKGDQRALMKAIRADRAVVGCPTAMQCTARAQLRKDEAFFKDLQSALTGPSGKEVPHYDPLRYTFMVLREVGVRLTQAQLEELMVDTLKLYKPGKGDPRKNLWAQYTRFMKLKTI